MAGYRASKETKAWLASLWDNSCKEAIEITHNGVCLVTVFHAGGRLGTGNRRASSPPHTPYSLATGIARGERRGSDNPNRLVEPTPELRERAAEDTAHRQAVSILFKLEDKRRRDKVRLSTALPHLEAALAAVEEAS